MTAVTIHPYRPGAIGETVRHHAIYYLEHWAFDVRFETQVARDISEFISQMDSSQDGFWWAEKGDKFAGAVAVDGTCAGKGQARIRWFIVPERFQNDGVGTLLFDQALQFCRERDFRSVYLWTFEGLGAARKLYERTGFKLVEEQQGSPWGPDILEQKFEMEL